MVKLNLNTNRSQISDDELIARHKNRKENIFYLYELMAKRADDNNSMAEYLFSVISSESFRKEVMKGPIMHSWYPAICILQISSKNIKRQLKTVISKNWTRKEKDEFLSYINREKEYMDLLHDI